MGEGIRTGQMLGPYTISAQIGEGGMGEVYRARDTKLNRDVALKILPSAFAVDPDRLARFKREAHVLAALNHPHIAAIYGFEESTGVQALVLELVEGPTLADRLARGPIPLDEVLPIAAQIAQALEAAHEQGIIHRDLKPANIKLRPDGAVKVLDFGLAKALEPAAGMAAGMTASPTLTTPVMTALGVVLGTAAYMSPEQARGKPLDKRTDIWSFGCVLYEMLTGRPAFPGDTISDTIAAILGDDPDWGRLSGETSDNVRRLLQRCLEKDPKQRLHDIADAGIEIHDAQSKAHSAVIASPVPVVTRRGRERLAWTMTGLLAMVSVVAVAVAIAVTLRPTPAAREVRLEITTPPTTDQVSLALSPDGEKLVFAAESEGQPRLWLRSLEAGSAHPLPGTDRGAYPFWSPDSRSIGFFAEGKLKRLDIAGGPAQTLADALIGRGGTWSRNGVILFAPSTFSRIFRVSDRGGEPVAVTGGEMPKAVGYRFPQFLPNGRHFLFSVVGAAQDRGVYVASLDGSVMRRLVDADTAVVLASGHLLFVRQGALFVQSFDPVRLELAGNPFPVAEDILFSGAVNISVLSSSNAGSIVYRTRAASDQRQFLWFDRSGKEMGRVGEPDTAIPANPQLSPDGRRVALNRSTNGQLGIWLLETRGGVLSRFTFDGAPDAYPVWSPDSRRLVFVSNRKGTLDLYEKPASGGGMEEPLLVTPEDKVPTDWSVDGRIVLYRRGAPNHDFDIWALPMDGNRKAFPVIQTDSDERDGQFSPDGKWIAYESNESGRFEIYVQPFPGPGGKRQMSTNGGAQVRWRPNGKELFYIGLDGRLMAAPFRLGSNGQAVEPGTPASLFATRIPGGPLQAGLKQQYVVSRDGQRFLINSLMAATASPITLVLNWKPRS
jgi:Tol biopolymer transport system component